MRPSPALPPEALGLPTVTSLNPGQPPVLVLDDHRVIRVADLPAPLFLPETAYGVGLLLSDWRTPDAPAYLIPPALVPALIEASQLHCAATEETSENKAL